MNLTPEQIPQSHDPEGERMYHDTDGFYAERLDDGSVRLCKYRHGTTALPVDLVMDHTIPAERWVSLVAAVSAQGASSESYAAAKDVHG